METAGWDVIDNPITGERLRFLERSSERVVMEITFPAGGLPVVKHRHPGFERFQVESGTLDLTVGDELKRLGPGEEFTVTDEFHFPANSSGEDAVVHITGEPGAFMERGLRVAFGLARDGRVRPDGAPRDMLSLALVSERGKYQIAGPPRWLWVSSMTVLGWVAVLAGRRRLVESYWPPDLERPWRTRSVR
ncbi:cupin domain-containing protein [Paenarthrobacter sp. PH39-S1]|uniref:cupin domain-containing protein n=1 Tax=Paenarthrobacter sp. PH39-S1 TaxID=3046204 RepID=UPI0024B99008|nr:cupin domain-containing protein [Paenarthrobacter sp. PH39-S1]MDJ0355660.1 cupin domain-containing protein [Paenarthrobacter sp. PH39-S1]